ncbi:MAG: gamma subclass chorismate mutase AroQ [Proteobacteria bacterium]|nr:gamma subclass chorismate mutase AroQ [Pseudomonadota bacterium]
MRYVISLLIVVLTVGTASARDPVASSEILRLEELIVYRLSLMRDVAAWKWRNNKPIEDLAREAQVLDSTSRRAEALGLDPGSSRAFVTAQMEAAKAVQRHWFAIWTAEGFPENDLTRVPIPEIDLATVLRPAIGRAGYAILEQIALVRPLLQNEEQLDMLALYVFMRAEHMGLSQHQARELAEAAALIQYAPRGTVLDRILARGTLRVGTTGDYAPFSLSVENGFKGLDIDLAGHLADSLGVEVEFVQTSWPTLMDDFQAGKFDIGMSGITRTLERQKIAYFSDPYQDDGKAPIVRCGEEESYDTLQEINRPGVRLVVNPGGTNEKFVRARAADADIRVIDDNRVIFGEIAEGRADVMITDQTEVHYQSLQTEALCPAMAGTFTKTQKAFLLPRDDAWLHYVNAWLGGVRDGTLDALVEMNWASEANPIE